MHKIPTTSFNDSEEDIWEKVSGNSAAVRNIGKLLSCISLTATHDSNGPIEAPTGASE